MRKTKIEIPQYNPDMRLRITHDVLRFTLNFSKIKGFSFRPDLLRGYGIFSITY
jgi:hypothetical protein